MKEVKTIIRLNPEEPETEITPDGETEIWRFRVELAHTAGSVKTAGVRRMSLDYEIRENCRKDAYDRNKSAWFHLEKALVEDLEHLIRTGFFYSPGEAWTVRVDLPRWPIGTNIANRLKACGLAVANV